MGVQKHNSIVIKHYSEADRNRWDDYVKSNPQGTFFHLSGWQRVISNAFSHACYYLYAEQDGEIVGLLPLVEVKSRLFGHALISTPFCVYGGAIANDDATLRLLEQHACQLATSLNVDYLELRYQTQQASSLLLKQAHSYFTCPIADTDEAILASVKKKQRAVIRHALNNNLSFNIENDLASFYQVFSESYRNLGTPIFSKSYFAELLAEFGQSVDIATVRDDKGQMSSAVMNFYYQQQVLPYYGGGNDNARQLKSADLMYYQVMCHAKDKGCNVFDFGRSKNDSGPFKYKKNWGMEPKSLYYYYYLVKADSLPNLSPNNPKYRLFITLWQKLPLKISQLIGPYLSKYLG